MSPETENDRKPLLSEFPPATPDVWRQAAEKLLKGAPFGKKMSTRTHEGIELQPIYHRPDAKPEAVDQESEMPGEFPFRRGSVPVGSAPWLIAQELPYPTYEEFNKALREDLGRGQNAVFLPLDRASLMAVDPDQAEASTIGSKGVSIASVAGFGKALAGIDFSTVPLYIEGGIAGPLFLAVAVAHARKSRVEPRSLRGCVGSDPLGLLVSEGELRSPLDAAYDEMAVASDWAEKNTPGLRTIAVSTRSYHDGGASAVEELAFAIATGTEYVREMTRRGIPPEMAVRQVWFSLSVGPQFFLEIAKLRAARVLWANVGAAFGVHDTAGAMVMHIRTSSYNATRVDPYVNMLRATTEALSGAIGGCTSMHVGRFDEECGQPGEFSRRIARNVQILLQKESHIDHVVDPVGGSWYVEALTADIAKRAWELFQRIEQEGGMAVALRSGLPQSAVADTARRRVEALALRKDAMVGITTYANPLEVPLEETPDTLDDVRMRRTETLRNLRMVPDRAAEPAVLDRLSRILETGRDSIMNALIDAASQGATIGEMRKAWQARRGGKGPAVEPIVPQRRALAFEELRALSDAFTQRTGNRPVVFLATMGPRAQHKARADFAAGFMAAGGCTVITGTGYATPEEAVEAAIASGAPAMVICSTDETYPALVPLMCAEVKKRKPSLMIALAGYPADHVESFRQDGIEAFIHLRAHVPEVLCQMFRRMGVTA
jgi:methylmalonyl-CoA mutase